MTSKQYIAACKSLGISPAYGAAKALGISVASAQRYAKGTWPVPETVAKLLDTLIELERRPATRVGDGGKVFRMF